MFNLFEFLVGFFFGIFLDGFFRFFLVGGGNFFFGGLFLVLSSKFSFNVFNILFGILE